MSYYYIQPGATLTAAQQQAVTSAGAQVVTLAPPSGLPASGMAWAETTPALVEGVLTQQWQQVTAPALSPARQAEALVARGCAVVSAATPALDGTYPLDATHLAWLTSLVAGVSASEGLPGGAGTVAFPDVTGALHSFTAAQLVAFAAALRDVFYAAQMVLNGSSTTLPAQPATIP